MKPLIALLALVLAAPAAEHRYDAFAKCVLPFLNIFAKERKTDARAFALKVRIEQGTEIPKEFLNAPAEIALQVPDKLRLHGPLRGETITLLRVGEKIWAHPGAAARALLDAAMGGKSLPPPEKGFALGDFKLPFPEKQIAFLATVFEVRDHGFELLDGVECRVLDVKLMPELAAELDGPPWIARLWITPDHQPARLTLARQGWHLVLRIDDVQFAKAMPPATWQPAPGALELSVPDYSRFFRAIGRAVNN
jgi:hypothetical protein